MRLLLLRTLTLTCIVNAALATESTSPPEPISEHWLTRPWEIRYLIFVGQHRSMQANVEAGRQQNIKSGQSDHAYLMASEFFAPQKLITVDKGETIATFLVSFDFAGKIHSANADLNAMSGKRSLLDQLVAVTEAKSGGPAYYLADFAQGIPGDVTFSPAVCIGWEHHRYKDDWDPDNNSGGFGCREWTAQLYRDDADYIDVTSYSRRGSFIGEFVGWARFSDPPKPIIGKQGNTWLCLHDCPAGEKPGIIASIKAWSEKHHFQLPKRPQQQPEFPNSRYKDDLKEEFED